MLIPENTTLVMAGDSITQAFCDDCREDVPWSAKGGLGRGYVAIVNALLQSRYPHKNINILNRGNSGNTVVDLAARWDRDVLEAKPEWISIMIGINDVWRHHDTPLAKQRHVARDAFAENLGRLAASAKKNASGVVLMGPYVLEPNHEEPMRAMMDQFGDVTEETAKQHEAIFVDLQSPFNELMNHRHPSSIAWDRIHLSMTGHMVIAKAFLDAVGFEWS